MTDVDRAKAFYTEQAGFVLDHDHADSDEIRFVQLTSLGSACSIAIGRGLTDAPPGSVKGMQMVVPDIETAHGELAARGVDVGEIQDFPWGRFVFFEDPDGNVPCPAYAAAMAAASSPRSSVGTSTTNGMTSHSER